MANSPAEKPKDAVTDDKELTPVSSTSHTAVDQEKTLASGEQAFADEDKPTGAALYAILRTDESDGIV